MFIQEINLMFRSQLWIRLKTICTMLNQLDLITNLKLEPATLNTYLIKITLKAFLTLALSISQRPIVGIRCKVERHHPIWNSLPEVVIYIKQRYTSQLSRACIHRFY